MDHCCLQQVLAVPAVQWTENDSAISWAFSQDWTSDWVIAESKANYLTSWFCLHKISFNERKSLLSFAYSEINKEIWQNQRWVADDVSDDRLWWLVKLDTGLRPELNCSVSVFCLSNPKREMTHCHCSVYLDCSRGIVVVYSRLWKAALVCCDTKSDTVSDVLWGWRQYVEDDLLFSCQALSPWLTSPELRLQSQRMLNRPGLSHLVPVSRFDIFFVKNYC